MTFMKTLCQIYILSHCIHMTEDFYPHLINGNTEVQEISIKSEHLVSKWLSSDLSLGPYNSKAHNTHNYNIPIYSLMQHLIHILSVFCCDSSIVIDLPEFQWMNVLNSLTYVLIWRPTKYFLFYNKDYCVYMFYFSF